MLSAFLSLYIEEEVGGIGGEVLVDGFFTLLVKKDAFDIAVVSNSGSFVVR